MELITQEITTSSGFFQISLGIIILLSGAVWTSQARKVTRIDNKVKGLAVALLFLVRNSPSSIAGAGPHADEANKNAIRALTEVLKM